MRLCRVQHAGAAQAAFYFDERVILLGPASTAFGAAGGEQLDVTADDDLLQLLPPDGTNSQAARRLYDWCEQNVGDIPTGAILPLADTELLVPVPRPNKLFLLAGNYAKHIEEGGEIAAERAETFPYVFMKPPSTTLTNPGDPIRIPKVSQGHIDWELELAVVIGRGGKHITEANALDHVAGYTIVNDISDRQFRPNPNRKERPKDAFFDWLHGKWHDSSCPIGPCIASSDVIPDPQTLAMQLRVNGNVHQDATTAQQIFPVAAVIEFLSRFVTLEPGDIISTGTSAGVGNTTSTFLRPGDIVEASIESIGTLVSPVTSEE